MKLKLEIRTFNRAFYAQIANTVCICILGFAVLFLYQWPQLQQTEAARISAEEALGRRPADLAFRGVLHIASQRIPLGPFEL